MEEQIFSVRKCAREAFEKHCRKSRERRRDDGRRTNFDRVEPRLKWKDLSEALMLHACRYAAAKAAEASRAVPMVIRNSRRKLGTSSATEITKEWMLMRLERLEALRKNRIESRLSKYRDEFLPTTDDTRDDVRADSAIIRLPEWIRQIRAEHYATQLQISANLKVVRAPPSIATRPVAPVDDRNGYLQYLKRATAARSSGVLISNPLKASSFFSSTTSCEKGLIDIVDTMIARYSSRPDEVYRRVSSKRFARYRRSKTKVELAEAEMSRRRGADRLLTARGANDPTVMAFDGGDHAYAFSTRITEAPRLRGKMVRKYTTPAPQPLVQRPEGFARAIAFAENAPMFHTRVMDRFR